MISSISWGIVLILFGLAILIKALFGIDIPLFRIIVGCTLVYYGINFITNIGITIPQNSHQETTRFGSSTIHLSGYGPLKQEYNTIFGKLRLVLEDNILLARPQHTKIRTIFGATELIIPAHVTAQLNIVSMFGSTQVKDSHVSFGEKTIFIGPADHSPHLIIDVDTIFGSCSVKSAL